MIGTVGGAYLSSFAPETSKEEVAVSEANNEDVKVIKIDELQKPEVELTRSTDNEDELIIEDMQNFENENIREESKDNKLKSNNILPKNDEIPIFKEFENFFDVLIIDYNLGILLYQTMNFLTKNNIILMLLIDLNLLDI